MNVRDYLTLLREHKLLIGACIATCVLVAGAVTVLLPKQYASTVTFYIVADAGLQTVPSETYQGAQLSADKVKSYTELVKGPRVAEDAAKALGSGTTADDVMSQISATSVAETVIITMTATDKSPDRAVAVAAAVSDSFTQLVLQLETPAGPGQVPRVTAEVVQPPSIPGSAVSPILKINLFIGLFIGLILGFGVAVTRRALNVSVRSTEDLEDASGAVLLGVVPEDDSTRRRPVSLVVNAPAGDMTEYRTEAYRRIRTNLEFANSRGNRRVLVFTSALPADGRTITACNVAAALSAVGTSVILVEGDLRRPRIADYLGLDASAGLAGVLAGRASLNEALQKWTPGCFDVLASGDVPLRPNELLSSRRAGDVIDELRSRYDYVLIDSPPILPVTDAVNLGAHADGVVMVCRWGMTRRPQVQSAVGFLRAVSVPVVGTVLSRTPRKQIERWTYPGTGAAGRQPGRDPSPAVNGVPRPAARDITSNVAQDGLTPVPDVVGADELEYDETRERWDDKQDLLDLAHRDMAPIPRPSPSPRPVAVSPRPAESEPAQ